MWLNCIGNIKKVRLTWASEVFAWKHVSFETLKTSLTPCFSARNPSKRSCWGVEWWMREFDSQLTYQRMFQKREQKLARGEWHIWCCLTGKMNSTIVRRQKTTWEDTLEVLWTQDWWSETQAMWNGLRPVLPFWLYSHKQSRCWRSLQATIYRLFQDRSPKNQLPHPTSKCRSMKKEHVVRRPLHKDGSRAACVESEHCRAIARRK